MCEAGAGGYTQLSASVHESMGIICTKICFEDKFHTLALHCSMYLLALVFSCTPNPKFSGLKEKKTLNFLRVFQYLHS